MIYIKILLINYICKIYAWLSNRHYLRDEKIKVKTFRRQKCSTTIGLLPIRTFIKHGIRRLLIDSSV